MIVPTPIEDLPGFDSGNNSDPGSNPWLKFIIVSGIVGLAIVFSASAMRRAQQKTIKFKPKENDNEKK
jgi:hypothetical protein